MSTLEDKILGEKLHNYCSSSEDEGDSEGSDEESIDKGCKSVKDSSCSTGPPPVNSWSGTASNTGPKGVIEDWRRYKQLEAENRVQLERERIALAKKLTLSVKTESEETKDKKDAELEEELSELIDEDFLLKYQKQRMQELMAQLQKSPQFGRVITLSTGDDFLKAIDKEDPKVTVVIHIYNENNSACGAMDGCLNVLATEYTTVKFCRIAAGVTGLSRHFHVEGVPALLVYKGGQIIGNFVRLSTELGNDFFATDVERFLIEFGILPEK
ncbi:Phosducin-like protein [Eumeta japonica]|uniref:Phosducin-like protein n=1 Tax=Eumeta variegata TaxID=151549 RepID=A0A4C1Z7P6_EUMVA|nr:Phosducin-like protein [Eumeta japonica]